MLDKIHRIQSHLDGVAGKICMCYLLRTIISIFRVSLEQTFGS